MLLLTYLLSYLLSAFLFVYLFQVFFALVVLSSAVSASLQSIVAAVSQWCHHFFLAYLQPISVFLLAGVAQ